MTRMRTHQEAKAYYAAAGTFQDKQGWYEDGGYSDMVPFEALEPFNLDCLMSIDPRPTLERKYPRNGLEGMMRAVDITHHAFADYKFAQPDLCLRVDFNQNIRVLEYHHKRRSIASGARIVLKNCSKIKALLCA